MIPGLDDYLQRLERELRLYGLADPRIIEEAREHFVVPSKTGGAEGYRTLMRSRKRSNGSARRRSSRRTYLQKGTES